MMPAKRGGRGGGGGVGGESQRGILSDTKGFGFVSVRATKIG